MNFYLLIIAQLLLSSLAIENLMSNDLNLIASNLDDIPDTSLQVQLVLLAYDCRNVMVSWKTNENEAKSLTINSVSKIFGYQIVIKELLKNENDQSRIYTSKYISLTDSKFRLTNLLYNNLASYLICLVIYFDAVEAIAFEKECVSFELPQNTLCTNDHTSSSKGLNNLTINRASKMLETENENGILTNKNVVPEEFRNLTGNSESLECDLELNNSYNKVVIGFVICILLLSANIIMFTIILIQNWIILSQKHQPSQTFQKDSTLKKSNFLEPTSKTKSSSVNTLMGLFAQSNSTAHIHATPSQTNSEVIFHVPQSQIRTLTRPGYVLNIPSSPSTSVSSESIKIRHLHNSNESRKSDLLIFDSDSIESYFNDQKDNESYDDEIFYHFHKNTVNIPNSIGPQKSSAF